MVERQKQNGLSSLRRFSVCLVENHNGAIADKWKDKLLGLQDLDLKKD